MVNRPRISVGCYKKPVRYEHGFNGYTKIHKVNILIGYILDTVPHTIVVVIE
jgi:hypothetical protein